MVNIGGTSAAGAPAPAAAEEITAAAGAALGDSPGGERDLSVKEEQFK